MKILSVERKGELYAIASGLFYGLLGYFAVSILNANFSIFSMLFWRFFVATIIIMVIALFAVKEIQSNTYQLFKICVSTSFFFSGTSVFYFLASWHIGTGLAMVIFFTYPIVIVAFTWFFQKQAITKVYYISLFFIIVGLVLLTKNQYETFDFYGIFFSFMSAICYVMYIVISKRQAKHLHPLILSLLVSFGCCIIFLVASILNQSFSVPSTLVVWFDVIGIGAVCTAFPILFLLKALQYIQVRKASILSVLEPVCIVIIGTIFLGEKITLIQAVGVIIILIGSLAVQFDKKTETF